MKKILFIITQSFTLFKEKLLPMNNRKRKKLDKKNKELAIEKMSIINKFSFPKWIVVGESVIGKSHINSNIPCQDNNFNTFFEKNWGIAIVCDGAGSAKNSDKGAEFSAKRALPLCFEELIKKEKWIEKNQLPTPDEWQHKATTEFKKTFEALSNVAIENNIELSNLACTAIVVIFSPIGLLVAHIGDGRAGFRNEQGKWSSIITPHKGEEANQTIFLTSNIWYKEPNLKMSEVSVPECRVIDEKPTAFVLMSDGCEQHSFECSIIDPNTGKWSDPNQPYDKFFNPLIDTLHKMATSPTTVDMQESWKTFLERGTEGLSNESDDKTMILGIFQ